MAIIPIPTGFGFSELPRFQLMRKSNQMQSKFTGARQALVYPFAIWMLEGKLVEADGTKAARFRSFLVQLDGVANKFRLPVPGYYRPSTGYGGNGSSGAAAVRAQSFVVTGLGPSQAIIRDGEYFNVNDELKMAVGDIASNAQGQATISFKPALRATVLSGTPVIFQNPTILMHSPDDDVATWSVKPPYRQNGTFRAIEAIEL